MGEGQTPAVAGTSDPALSPATSKGRLVSDADSDISRLSSSTIVPQHGNSSHSSLMSPQRQEGKGFFLEDVPSDLYSGLKEDEQLPQQQHTGLTAAEAERSDDTHERSLSIRSLASNGTTAMTSATSSSSDAHSAGHGSLFTSQGRAATRGAGPRHESGTRGASGEDDGASLGRSGSWASTTPTSPGDMDVTSSSLFAQPTSASSLSSQHHRNAMGNKSANALLDETAVYSTTSANIFDSLGGNYSIGHGSQSSHGHAPALPPLMLSNVPIAPSRGQSLDGRKGVSRAQRERSTTTTTDSRYLKGVVGVESSRNEAQSRTASDLGRRRGGPSLSKSFVDVTTLARSLTVDDQAHHRRNKPLPIPAELLQREGGASGSVKTTQSNQLPRVSVSPAAASAEEEASREREKPGLRSYLSRSSHLFKSSMPRSSEASTSPVILSSPTSSSSSSSSSTVSVASSRNEGNVNGRSASHSETHLSVSSAAERGRRSREPSAPSQMRSTHESSELVGTNLPTRSYSSFSFRRPAARKSAAWLAADAVDGGSASGKSSNSSSSSSSRRDKAGNSNLDRGSSTSSRSTQGGSTMNTTISTSSTASNVQQDKPSHAVLTSGGPALVCKEAKEGLEKKSSTSRPRFSKRFSFYEASAWTKGKQREVRDPLPAPLTVKKPETKAATAHEPTQSAKMVRGRSRSIEVLEIPGEDPEADVSPSSVLVEVGSPDIRSIPTPSSQASRDSRPSRLLSQRKVEPKDTTFPEAPPLSEEVWSAREGTLARLTSSLKRRPSSVASSNGVKAGGGSQVGTRTSAGKSGHSRTGSLASDLAMTAASQQKQRGSIGMNSSSGSNSAYASAESSLSHMTGAKAAHALKKSADPAVDAAWWGTSQTVSKGREDGGELPISQFRAAQLALEINEGIAGIGQLAMTANEDLDEEDSPASPASVTDNNPASENLSMETTVPSFDQSTEAKSSEAVVPPAAISSARRYSHKKSLSFGRILDPIRAKSRPSSAMGHHGKEGSNDDDGRRPSNAHSGTPSRRSSIESESVFNHLAPSSSAAQGPVSASRSGPLASAKSLTRPPSPRKPQKPPPVSYRSPGQGKVQQRSAKPSVDAASVTTADERHRNGSLSTVSTATTVKAPDSTPTKRSSSVSGPSSSFSHGHRRNSSTVSMASSVAISDSEGDPLPPPRTSSRQGHRTKSEVRLEKVPLPTQAPPPRKRAMSRPSLSIDTNLDLEQGLVKRPSSALGMRTDLERGGRLRHGANGTEPRSDAVSAPRRGQPTLSIADDVEFLQALEHVRRAHQDRIAKQTAEATRVEQMARLGMASGNRRANKSSAGGVGYPSAASSGATTIYGDKSGRARLASQGLGTRIKAEQKPPGPSSPRRQRAHQRSSSADGRLDGPSALQVRRTMRGERDPYERGPWHGGDASAGAGVDGEDAPSALQLGVGRASGKLKDGPFINDDDWKKEVKALFVIRELVLTERSYARHLEALLQAIRALPCYNSGSSALTNAPRRRSTSALKPNGASVFSHGSNNSGSSSNNSVKSSAGPAPLHIQMMRNLLPQLITLSRTLANRIDEDPTAAGVGAAFRLVGVQMEATFVAWSVVAREIMDDLRKTEGVKSKSIHKIGLISLINNPVEEGADEPAKIGVKSVPTSPTKAYASMHPTPSPPPPVPAPPLEIGVLVNSSVEERETMKAAASSSIGKRASTIVAKRRSTFSATPPSFLRPDMAREVSPQKGSAASSSSTSTSSSPYTNSPLCESPKALKKQHFVEADFMPTPTSSAGAVSKTYSGGLPQQQQQHSSSASTSLGRRAIGAVVSSSARSPLPSMLPPTIKSKSFLSASSSSRANSPASSSGKQHSPHVQQPQTTATTTTTLKKLGPLDVAIMPTQRIPRYLLLLKDLISNTPPQSLSHVRIQRSLDTVRKVAVLCDSASKGVGGPTTRSGSTWR